MTSAAPRNPLLIAALRGRHGQLELRLRLAQDQAERAAQLAISADTDAAPLDRVIATTAAGVISAQDAELIINAQPSLQAAAQLLGDSISAAGQGAVAVKAEAGSTVTINIYTPSEAR